MSILKWGIICFALYCISVRVVVADEDDSFEVFEDIVIGMSIAACEADEECSNQMDSLFFPLLVIAIISCIVCPPPEEEDMDYPKPKRVARVGASYVAGKMIFS